MDQSNSQGLVIGLDLKLMVMNRTRMMEGNAKEGTLKLAIICQEDMFNVWVSRGHKRIAGWTWCPVVGPDLPCRNQPTELFYPHFPVPFLIFLIRRFT